MKRWRNLRHKYVRLRKKIATRSGDTGDKKPFLSWLGTHVNHLETDSNTNANTTRSDSVGTA